ncbi:MAG: NAD-dependent deacetylase [Treponema sp.]|jgi:NAD-dependent deacetylase|nr:NAD-dependent deacetylase [Treponema sp.]
MDDKIEKLIDKISAAKHCVAFTGAGVSTLSGIQDFRGKNGLYTTNPAVYQKMFDIDWFESDPDFYYKAAKDFIYGLNEKQPSVVHNVLSDWEKRGRLKALITQNIDLLHQKAGSVNVIEVHGSPLVHYCMRCGGVRMSFEEAAAIVKGGGLPRCPKCGRALKPSITFFGEALPASALAKATAEAQSADVMLVLGSSLTVNPAASLPRLVLLHGGELVIVNDMETYLDRHAVLRFDNLAEVFGALALRMGGGAH